MDRTTKIKTRFALLKENAKANELVKCTEGGDNVNADGLPTMQKIFYSSLPVEIPDDFLLPLQDPATIKVNQINWSKTTLPEYKGCYAVILDNVINEAECNQLLHMAECSAGGHLGDESVPDHGWRPAMVNAGRNYEFLDMRYRNSDRIIWDNQDVMQRIWKRVLQGKGMKEYFSVLEGKKYKEVLGMKSDKWGDRWLISANGPNERLRFLKYGPGQFFKPHCDGKYTTPDGKETSFYTMHLYLNDSAQALDGLVDMNIDGGEEEMLQGGATTFHGTRYQEARLDADPKIGRVLIFQQRRLLHSGDEVVKGTKYTMRSDLMYSLDESDRGDEDGIVFGE
ncbi:hypothetical protein GLAREA_09125 [Glarea lozoyensis ATCC 20868]|uniref:Prolyl 4-hydroxylase alpha subunit domain-containing protein n=2 Tax=Glarea lozoyensis TaxID=101852 RepID=S3DEX3_GLAL2|nr:uncharacterized protein GLAREA_09125 [Glarea lozoyensis ATCC 20868]EHK99079.1 hypothetical protein M7I_5079 [Glarea lozoyensis 74030]EPE36962.1 hypothetical protein GLAREA_09125 [Glarea lozoyensis ATCC 20868]